MLQMYITSTVGLDFYFSSLESVYCRLAFCFRAHFRLISEFGCRMNTVDCLERQSASLRNYPDVFLCRVVKWHVKFSLLTGYNICLLYTSPSPRD